MKYGGQENYGENVEIDWFKVYNFTTKYNLLDFREDLEDIVFELKNNTKPFPKWERLFFSN